MNVEQTLTDELETVARSVGIPPPPAVALLVREAEASHRPRLIRSGATVLVAAAAVLGVIALGNGLDHPGAAPSPTHPTKSATDGPLPAGAPPRIPYVVHGTLYILGRPVTGKWWDVETVQGTTVAVRADQAIGRPVLFLDEEPTHLLDDAVGAARLSAKGTKLAWLEKSGSSAHLVLYDVLARRELGRVPVDPRLLYNEEGTQISIRALDDDGTVTYGGELGMLRWGPGAAPTSVTGSDVESTAGFPAGSIEVHQNGDGNWGAWLTDRDGASPTAVMAKKGVLDGVTFQAPYAPRSRFTIALPGGYEARTLTWESATEVLLTYSDHPDSPFTRFLRCSVEDRHCELVPTPGDP
jgi:hypothetical protein